MLFSEVIGQQTVKQQLIQTVKENRVSHAQLFYGPQGSGKLALAIAYAQYISCTGKKTDDSCGNCPSCHKYSRLVHPDLHFVFPVISGQGKASVSDSYIDAWREMVLKNPYFNLNMWLNHIGAENKQGSIMADEAREIIRKLSLKTFEAEYKVMIVWLPERMNNAAANKLLKILEEPPDKTLFILVADTHEDVLPTILSRAQPRKIPAIDSESLSAWLMKQFGVDQAEAIDVCRMSAGNYFEACNHIDASNDFTFNFNNFVALMRLAYAKNVGDMVKWVSNMAGIGREKQKEFIEYALRMLRGNFLMNSKLPDLSFLVQQEVDFSKKFSAFITNNNVEAIANELDKAAYHIERNGNPKIVFTDLAFTLMVLLRQA